MSNIYMLIPSIKGSASAKGYEDAIALHSLSFNSERTIKMPIGNAKNRESSKPYFSEALITKSIDNATNNLFQQLCNGQSIPEVEIHVCTTDSTHEAYAKYTLKNVLISQHSHSVVADGQPVERLKLNYTHLQITFIPRDHDNKPQSQIVSGYNLETASLA